jgi:hypothetical protein
MAAVREWVGDVQQRQGAAAAAAVKEGCTHAAITATAGERCCNSQSRR